MEAILTLFIPLLILTGPKDCVKKYPEIDKRLFQHEATLGIPKSIIWSLIWTESRCQNNLNEIGPSGEIGLGQIIPRDHRKQYPYSWFSDRPLESELRNPQTNADWIVKILYTNLKGYCKNDIACALAVYNEGTRPTRKGYAYAWKILTLAQKEFYP